MENRTMRTVGGQCRDIIEGEKGNLELKKRATDKGRQLIMCS